MNMTPKIPCRYATVEMEDGAKILISEARRNKNWGGGNPLFAVEPVAPMSAQFEASYILVASKVAETFGKYVVIKDRDPNTTVPRYVKSIEVFLMQKRYIDLKDER